MKVLLHLGIAPLLQIFSHFKELFPEIDFLSNMVRTWKSWNMSDAVLNKFGGEPKFNNFTRSNKDLILNFYAWKISTRTLLISPLETMTTMNV